MLVHSLAAVEIHSTQFIHNEGASVAIHNERSLSNFGSEITILISNSHFHNNTAANKEYNEAIIDVTETLGINRLALNFIQTNL